MIECFPVPNPKRWQATRTPKSTPHTWDFLATEDFKMLWSPESEVIFINNPVECRKTARGDARPPEYAERGIM
jgi:hypothetical protein